MPLGTASAIILGGGLLSAGMQAGAGQNQAKAIKQQAEYNAKIYEQQASMIQEKRKIQNYQLDRQSARMRSAVVASAAGRGLNLSGSPLAILIDNETQMQYDKAIEDYNLQIDYGYALSGASYTRATGANQSRLARAKGYSNAFSTALNAGYSSWKLGGV